jgi:hypothetical protein
MPQRRHVHALCVVVVLLFAPVGLNVTMDARVPSDAYEPDDIQTSAKLIVPGEIQQHNFHLDGDEDWVKFQVTAGRPFTIFTSRLSIDVDTVIELYATDGTTYLDENDDGGADLWSRLSFTAEETGYYYVKVRQYGALGTGGYSLTMERQPGVFLNNDLTADVLTYASSSGDWRIEASNGSGGFIETPGSWSPGWTITPASFDDDALTDFLLFNPSSGQWAKVINNGAGGFTTQASGGWWPGWERYIINLDDDGHSDVFLYDPATGTWFKCISTPSGFTYEQGGWNPGWEIYPVRLNVDHYDDLFLINRDTGRWFWVMGDPEGFFYPVSETWFSGWVIYPGDFNGDGLDDFLLHDPATGTYFVAFTGDLQFAYVQGGWSLGWTPYVADLNGDGADDLFLHASATGKWFHMISDGAGGFTNAGGETWSLGWSLQVSDFNNDGRGDLFLYAPSSGTWYQALTSGPGAFTYGSGAWSPNLQVVVRPPIR